MPTRMLMKVSQSVYTLAEDVLFGVAMPTRMLMKVSLYLPYPVWLHAFGGNANADVDESVTGMCRIRRKGFRKWQCQRGC